MDPALATSTPSGAAIVFQDGLGERRRATDSTGTETVERLCLRYELTKVPSFEFALRERTSRLASFRLPCFAAVRSIDRLNDATSTLAVVSESIRGVRLSALLAKRDRPTIDINAAVHLIRQLVSAVAVLHETAPDVAHGAIAPERIIITPNARAIVVEHVLGAALEQLHYSRDRYWADLRVALPASATISHLDQRADVVQLGIVALSLILGRLLESNEYPTLIADVLASTQAISRTGEREPLPSGLRTWLAKTLQLDSRGSFQTALEAREDLERVLSEEEDEVSEELVAEVPAPPPPPAPARSAIPVVSMPPTAAPRAPVATPPPSAPPASVAAAPAPTIIAPPKPVAPPPTAATPVVSKPLVSKPLVSPPLVSTPLVSAPHVPAPLVSAPAVSTPVVKTPAVAPPVVTPTVAAAPAASKPTAHAPAAATPSVGSVLSLSRSVTEPPAPMVSAPIDPVPLIVESDEEPAERSRRPMAVMAAVVAVVIAIGAFAAWRFVFSGPAAEVTGSISVTTVPAGAQVLIDGQPRGMTPLTLSLSPGQHALELRGSGEPRTMPITIGAGQQLSQYVELANSAASVGQLQVRTEPTGALVTVDGVARGKAPLVVDELPPGEHAVVLQSDLATVKQTVTIEAGQTASLVVPLGAAAEGAPVSGWLSVSAPVELQLFENKKLLGTSQSDRIMVSAGRHEIELVSDTLGYRVVRTVQVPAGKVAPIALNWPSGSISLNAAPWAEVWIDDKRIGETPIGNLSLPIGPHEVSFRHPDLGEQRQAITVSLKEPVRVSVDMRKKP
jgi:PEGA domain-containing protein